MLASAKPKGARSEHYIWLDRSEVGQFAPYEARRYLYGPPVTLKGGVTRRSVTRSIAKCYFYITSTEKNKSNAKLNKVGNTIPNKK